MIIDSKARKDIEIGRIGENEARKIWFHIGNILSDFPGASFTLMHKRPGDIAAYPVNSSYIEIEDNSLYWTVQSGDLTTEGIGYCELEATKDGAVVKTEIFRTKILPALDDSEDPPEPWESWVGQVAADAEDAADSAEDAEAWAVGQRGGEDVGSSDPTYHNNAKYWSDQAEETLSSKADKVSGATSGNFAGLDGNGNLTDSGHKHSDYLTSHQDISGKADKVDGGTENNFAGLDSNGNLKDSGSKASDFLTSHQDISGKADKVSSAVSGNFAGLDGNGNLTDSGHKHSDYLTAHQDITGKADKVSSAVSGNFAGLDGNGNLTDSGSKASDFLTEHQDISGKLDKTDFYATEMPMGSSDSTKVSAEIGNLKSAIDGKADAIEIIDSTSEAIKSFTDGADGMPMAVTVGIEPVQDLNGYDNPWPAGGGKNLVNVDDITGVTSQTEIGGTFTLPAGTYVLSAYISNSGIASVALRISKSDNTLIGTTGYSASTLTRQSKSFTLEESTTCKLSVVGSASGYNGSVSKVQIETGTSPTDYAPYANICPISGWTGANVTRTGKNLLNGNLPSETGYAFGLSSGTPAKLVNSSWSLSNYIPVSPGIAYTFSGMSATYNTNTTVFEWSDADKNFISYQYINNSQWATNGLTATAPQTANYCRVSYKSTDSDTVQFEKSSATAYEAYKGITYSITFPNPPGTVYGGTLTVNKDGSGKLVVTHVLADATNLSWNRDGSTRRFRSKVTSYSNTPWKEAISNALKSENSSVAYANRSEYSITIINQNYYQVDVIMPSTYDITAFNSFIANVDGNNTHLTIMLKYNTPVEYTLTAEQVGQILSLKGENNLFADTGNVLNLEYVADTKMYVDQNEGVKDVQVNGTSVVTSGVANVPVMSASQFGVAKTKANRGIAIDTDGTLKTDYAATSKCKAGTDNYLVITPGFQHVSAFYGIAKAAGDSTQSSSSNNVGTYTESAKSAISQMLDAPETVSGSTPSITAKPGVRYVCGEVSTLTITVPENGCIDVVFESGSTATVLTVTPTKTGVSAIKWANGFDPSSLEANTTYEVNILDGEFGVVGKWT